MQVKQEKILHQSLDEKRVGPDYSPQEYICFILCVLMIKGYISIDRSITLKFLVLYMVNFHTLPPFKFTYKRHTVNKTESKWYQNNTKQTFRHEGHPKIVCVTQFIKQKKYSQ